MLVLLLVCSILTPFLTDAQLQNLTISCANGGTLMSDGSCRCLERFEGLSCEDEPCLNGGLKAGNGYCQCPFGWSGDWCEKATVCVNGHLENGTCVCHHRWTGGLCNIRLCVNGNHTMVGLCLCDRGYTGFFCDQTKRCNNGVLSPNNNCECYSGFAPPDCLSCQNELVLKNGRCTSASEILRSQASSKHKPTPVPQNAESSFFPWWIGLIGAFIGVPASGFGGVAAWKHWKIKKARVGSIDQTIVGATPVGNA